MGTAQEPFLTVAITTRNRWDQCLSAVRAMAKQTYVDFELLIIDDASVTGLPSEIGELLHSLGAEYLRQPSVLGLANARNRALEAAKGQYIAFCDDDDQWVDSAAHDLVGVMRDAPSDVCVGMLLPVELWGRNPLLPEYAPLAELMLMGVTPPVSAQVYRVKALRAFGGYRSQVTSGVDHDLWVSLARRGSRAAVIWGRTPCIGEALDGRMTTNETERRMGIANSLNIWREDLVATFDEDFFNHFAFCYDRYLDRNFLIQEVRRRNVIGLFRRLLARPRLVWDLLGLVAVVRRRRRWSTFAPFKASNLEYG